MSTQVIIIIIYAAYLLHHDMYTVLFDLGCLRCEWFLSWQTSIQ